MDLNSRFFDLRQSVNVMINEIQTQCISRRGWNQPIGVLGVRYADLFGPRFLRIRIWFTAAISLFGVGFVDANEEDVLELPVRFHLVRGVTQIVEGEKLENWVTKDQVEQVLLPEVNRIWMQAKIRFLCESVSEETISQSPERDQIVKQLTNIKRGEDSESSIRLCEKLVDPTKFDRYSMNLYFLPYVGRTFQGIADFGGNRVVVGEWSDKATGGREAPEKVLLTEPEPFMKGSLGRTLSHELGHNLRLKHPAKDATPMGRIMGGGKHGYLLTPEEIAIARESAQKRLKNWLMKKRELDRN